MVIDVKLLLLLRCKYIVSRPTSIVDYPSFSALRVVFGHV